MTTATLPDTLTHPKKRAFLAAYAHLGNITEAAKAATIYRTTHYDWLKTDPDYTAAYHQVREAAADRLETEALRRAVDGTERPIFYKGEQIATVTEYSDTLLIFLLKAARPDKYRERWHVAADVNVSHVTDLDRDIRDLVDRLGRTDPDDSPGSPQPGPETPPALEAGNGDTP